MAADSGATLAQTTSTTNQLGPLRHDDLGDRTARRMVPLACPAGHLCASGLDRPDHLVVRGWIARSGSLGALGRLVAWACRGGHDALLRHVRRATRSSNVPVRYLCLSRHARSYLAVSCRGGELGAAKTMDFANSSAMDLVMDSSLSATRSAGRLLVRYRAAMRGLPVRRTAVERAEAIVWGAEQSPTTRGIWRVVPAFGISNRDVASLADLVAQISLATRPR